MSRHMRVQKIIALLVFVLALCFSACDADNSATFPHYTGGNRTTSPASATTIAPAETTPVTTAAPILTTVPPETATPTQTVAPAGTTVPAERDDGLVIVYLPLTLELFSVNEAGEGVCRGQVSYAYDANGNRIKETISDPNGQMPASYTYDEHNNITSISANGELICHFMYTYDHAGNIITTQYTYYEYGKGTSIRLEYTYDASGNKLTEARYSEDGESQGLIEYQYDDRGNMIKVFQKKASLTYQYDSFDRLTSIFRGEAKAQEFVYNEDGNCVKRMDYSSEKVVQIVKGNYNADGMLTQLEYCAADEKCYARAVWSYMSMEVPAERAKEIYAKESKIYTSTIITDLLSMYGGIN